MKTEILKLMMCLIYPNFENTTDDIDFEIYKQYGKIFQSYNDFYFFTCIGSKSINNDKYSKITN